MAWDFFIFCLPVSHRHLDKDGPWAWEAVKKMKYFPACNMRTGRVTVPRNEVGDEQLRTKSSRIFPALHTRTGAF